MFTARGNAGSAYDVALPGTQVSPPHPDKEVTIASTPSAGWAVEPIWDMLGQRMPRGVLGVSDPDVHRIDDQWVMFIGGFSTSFRNRIYRARLPVGADLQPAGWRLDRDPITSDPPRGSWDAGGMHTPSYVPPGDHDEARIYYAGRASSQQYGEGSTYSIGVLRRQEDGRWLRHPTPVLRGWPERPSVLEPLVIRTQRGYRMWFLATPHEVAPGEQPDFQLHVSDSIDGTTWDDAHLFATREEGFFDNAVYPTDQGWEMTLARGTNLHGTDPYPGQGLWVMHAATPSPRRRDWSAPQCVLDTDAPGTPAWMGRGVCGPSVAFTIDGQRMVFLTGTHDVGSWPQAVRRRISRSRRLAVPAPYYLATGGGTLSLKH